MRENAGSIIQGNLRPKKQAGWGCQSFVKWMSYFMNILDVRTVILSYVVSNAISAVVIFFLWLQNHRRFAGLGFWLADFVMQFIALWLVVLRGSVPNFLSMTVSNTLIIGGTILLFMGLERFIGKVSTPAYNAILLAIFILIHSYFVYVHPNLDARTIILSAGVSVICFQCSWLLLRRVDAEMRPITSGVGLVFAGYSLVSIARIVVNLAFPSDNNFFNSNLFDALLVMTDQMLFIVLTFSLFLMVNRRLFTDLERDITERKRVEEGLRLSEEKFFKTFHSSPDAIILSRLTDGWFVEVNEGFSRITEYSREEALASSSINLNIWANPRDREEWITALLQSQRIHDHEYDFRTKSGKIINGICSGEIIQIDGEAYVLSVIHDITERKRAHEILRRSEERFRQLIISAPDAVIGVNQDGKIIFANVEATRLFGYQVDELLGRDVDLLIPIHIRAAHSIHRAGYAANPTTRPMGTGMEIIAMSKDGGIVLVDINLSHLDTEDGLLVIAFIRDITKRTQTEKKVQQLSRATEQSPASIVITDIEGKIEYVNPRFTQVTGYRLEEAVGKNPRILRTDQTPRETHEELWRTITAGKEWRGEFVNRKKNGELYYESASISPIIDAYGVTTHYVAVKEDITERKKAEAKIQLLQAELREQAIRDPLTGLYNRRYLYETLGRELARAERENYPISFVVIDIDHFKDVNDKFGHDAGDAILQKLSSQLMSQTRYGDIVCRYGGEEFLAILLNVTAEVAYQITERWRLSFLGSTLLLDHYGAGAKATISCGISEFPIHGKTDKELITRADKAMYQAKATGRNRVVVWRSELKG